MKNFAETFQSSLDRREDELTFDGFRVPFVFQVKVPSSIRWEDRTGLVESEFRRQSDFRRSD